MKITLHRDTIGQLPNGQWVEKRGGVWSEIAPPVWAVKPTQEALPMEDPLRRDVVARVTVKRTVTKEVTDYEAEVLCRNGWDRIDVCPDCATVGFGNIGCVNCRAFHGITEDGTET